MRVLIIGGTRFMGPWVVRRLVETGHEVTLFHRGQTETELPESVRHLHGERAELPRLAAELGDQTPDIVLDMFAMTEADARTVVATFIGVARRLVAISSMDVYRAFGVLINTEPGPVEPVPLTEDSPVRSRLYPYRSEPRRAADDPQRWRDDYDKILVERVVLGESRLPGTVLRLPMVYGPGDYQHRLQAYVRRMDDGRRAIPLDRQVAAWRTARGYVENVGAAIALATTDDRAAGRTYNVGEAEALREADWVQAIGRAAGWDGAVVTVDAPALRGGSIGNANTGQDLVADTGRIRQELGYAEPVPRDEAIARTVAWERAYPAANVDPAALDYAAEDDALARVRESRS